MNTRKFRKISLVGLSLLTAGLAAGCSRMTEFEGVQCIKTTDIAATNMECNWEKYNTEQKAKKGG